MTGLRIGVVGGSIAGCAMAIAGARAGADVTVHERSDGELQDRGFGIVIPPPLHRELVAGGYLGADMPTTPVATRVWLARAPGRRSSRELARQQAPVAPCNWGLLWRALRSNIGGSAYHRGRPVGSVGRTVSGGALIRTADGEREYDIVVGADGHRSVTRELIAPEVRPAPAGYLVWRGTIPPSALRDHPKQLALLETAWVTLGFPGGHGVFYLIPGAEPGSRLLAYAIYAPPPASATAPGPDAPVSAAHVRHIAEEHFPAEWADIVAGGEHTSQALHPVADFAVPRAADPPFLLAGDAASVTRPHTASGAVKALQDALCLERSLRASSSAAEALHRYADERSAEGTRLVGLGRRLGRELVEHTPHWPAMGPAEVDALSRAALNGTSSYLYGSVQRQ
ncbi:FAD-dependent monooxygenase [Streptomyces sp. NBC_01591]|uniref:FAD-dependent monooxygenase n=1 Tax=Streptomyces sp. NBC_01591 TaxID=2975888 RepID=UPI002DDAA8CF|nr:FAD-dependent monooxygenase [Streptomyces sp. NBC_01591]WSD71589.1 FAD-dependent monooxygenase [Streptomyces sp. NBC_01591]